MAIWLHPSVTSTIVDNSGFYATADGVTTLFAPGFFQKGKDNELIPVDGPGDADLVKKFGGIDAVEYGQNHLNLVNWLVAGGSAVVMRCLPDNAKYSHAILEVLTKESTVNTYTITVDEKDYEVERDYDVDGNFLGLIYYDEDGEKVLVCKPENFDKLVKAEELGEGESFADFIECDGTFSETPVSKPAVNVIPKITYVPTGVSKKETIEAYVRSKNGRMNDDGYTRHILGYFIPEGRGAIFYNEVRINITLASNYDNTYDFRVYSITFEKYDAENEEWGVIYGPYYVSFDETSRDFSNETMFIADILDKYCGEFTFVPFGANSDEESGEYNKAFYDAAKAIAGSEAPLRRVDVLSCQEYFSEAEESFSHIHHNTFVNGGSLILRKDIKVGSDKIYVEGGALPIVGADLIIANSIQRKVKSVNATAGEITVTDEFTKCAYTTAELNEMDEEERVYAETVAVVAAENSIIYVNDIKEPENKATVKTMDNAIEKINSHQYKVYLNKNGADFKVNDDITIDINPIQIWKEGDDPSTIPYVELSDVTDLNFDGVVNGAKFYISQNGEFVNDTDATLKFVHKDLVPAQPAIEAQEAQGEEGQEGYVPAVEGQPATLEIPAHWELIKGDVIIAESSNDGENPSLVSFSNFNCIYNQNAEDSYVEIVDNASFNAKIIDIDYIDDAITIEFKKVEQASEAIEKLTKVFDTFDFTEDTDSSTFDGATGGNYDELIQIKAIPTPANPFAKYLSLSEGDYAYMLYGSAGDADTADGASRAVVATTRKNLLIKAFRGTLNPAITMKKFWPIDIVLDANYDVSVKNAINELTLSREDFMFMCDTGFCATPEQAIEKRNGSLVYNNRYTAIFTQDMRVYDEYSSKNIKVTPTYFLAKKIPYVDRAYGIHYAFVGPNRGEIEGMVEGTLSWNPTEIQKEKLYKKQLNYIQHDPNHLMFMGQLTSQKRSTSLSDIPNVRALLMIRRNIEAICEEYYFERINENLLGAMSNACNTYLGQWVANGTLSKGNVSVYASEYDMKQKLVRVQVELTFTSFLERVVITFTVK